MPNERSPYSVGAALRRQRVLVLTLLALGVIIAVGAQGAAPLAGGLLAILLVVLAVLRAGLAPDRLGALAIRSRGVDVTVLLVLAAGLAVLLDAPNL